MTALVATLALAAVAAPPGYPWLDGAPSARTISTAVPAPPGFARPPLAACGYCQWLRGLPLQPEGAPVRLFDGRLKPSQAAAHAVIDLDVGGRDLQQCADVAIRLWAEYLWASGQADRLELRLTNGMAVPWRRWRLGWRVAVKGGRHTEWVRKAAAGGSRRAFSAYLRFLMGYAGTASLARDLSRPDLADLRPGDLLVQGGSPGHAVVVLDLVESPGGERLVLLGQSYMPAQDLHLLRNLGDAARSPWFPVGSLSLPGGLQTPEWGPFGASDLRRF